MDQTDFPIYEDFLYPSGKYECRNCGTSFGDECVNWDEEAQCQVAVCPVCGRRTVIGNEGD